MTATYSESDSHNEKPAEQVETPFDKYDLAFQNMKMTQNILYHLTTHIPIFYQGLLKLFSGSRRNWAAIAHQDAYAVGKEVAKVAYEGLVYRPFRKCSWLDIH